MLIEINNELKKNVIVKKIFKEKLDALQEKQAKLECKAAYEMDHFNLIKGLEYYENDKEYILIMEFASDAEYF